jgi:DNA-binding NtrC family response regulator
VFEKDEEIIKTKQSEETPGGNETILVVEDEEPVRNLAVKILRDLGYIVLDADQAEKGLLIFEQYQKPINLILTDVVMPKMNGVKFIERLMQVGKYFKVIYMTGHTDETIVNGLLDKKVNLILKPFTHENLARKVREVLDKDEKLAVERSFGQLRCDKLDLERQSVGSLHRDRCRLRPKDPASHYSQQGGA